MPAFSCAFRRTYSELHPVSTPISIGTIRGRFPWPYSEVPSTLMLEVPVVPVVELPVDAT